MRHELTKWERDRGRRTQQKRQAKHDRLCKPVLLRAAKSARPTIATGRRYLEEAEILPPCGKDWHTAQVWRIAKRLGIKLGRGLRPGVMIYCKRCGRGKRKLIATVSGVLVCDDCRWKASKAHLHRGIRKAELADAREKAAFYAAKVERLEAGVRHYPADRRKHYTAR